MCIGLDFYPPFTYHKRDEERRKIDRDGLITGGHVGYLDNDGYLYICDRKRDMIISGGVNIYPAEIGAAILGLPEVQDCVVFGVPHAEYGEALPTLVVRTLGSSEPGVQQRLQFQLEHRLPATRFRRTTETRDFLPLDGGGQLLKRSLREPYWKGVQRRI